MNIGENGVLVVSEGESVTFGPEYQLRDSVEWFARNMETVLQENDHKPGWETEQFDSLFKGLIRGVKELNNVVPTQAGSQDLSLQQISEIVENSVHVANFAMMLADKAHKRVVITDAGARTERVQCIQPNESGGQ